MIPHLLQHLAGDHNEWQLIMTWVTDFWPTLRIQGYLLRHRIRGWWGR